MNLIQRKIYLYNVTFGLYMLDWWERCLFNVLVIVLLWFICYNGSRSAAEFYTRVKKIDLFDYLCFKCPEPFNYYFQVILRQVLGLPGACNNMMSNARVEVMLFQPLLDLIVILVGFEVA